MEIYRKHAEWSCAEYEALLATSKSALEFLNTDFGACCSTSSVSSVSKEISTRTSDVAFLTEMIEKEKSGEPAYSKDPSSSTIVLKDIHIPILLRDETKNKKYQGYCFYLYGSFSCSGQIVHSELYYVDIQTMSISIPLIVLHRVLPSSILKISLLAAQSSVTSGSEKKNSKKEPLVFEILGQYETSISNLLKTDNKVNNIRIVTAGSESQKSLPFRLANGTVSGTFSLGTISSSSRSSSSTCSPSHSFYVIFRPLQQIAMVTQVFPGDIDVSLFSIKAKIKEAKELEDFNEQRDVYISVDDGEIIISDGVFDVHTLNASARIPINSGYSVGNAPDNSNAIEIKTNDKRFQIEFTSSEKARKYKIFLTDSLDYYQSYGSFFGGASYIVKKPSDICSSLLSDVSSLYHGIQSDESSF